MLGDRHIEVGFDIYGARQEQPDSSPDDNRRIVGE
jgi:hypothetical protein